jgi:ADP-heptose:LPS heptosyltransferase
MHWRIADGWPYRARPYLELLEGVESADYGNFQYSDLATIWSIQKCDTWKEVLDKGMGEVLIECNTWLESGKRLEDWMPDLPTDFHYPIHTTDIDRDRATELLKDFERPLWAVSAASYRGSEAWKTWGSNEWSEFLRKFKQLAGGTILLMGGFWDDLTSVLSAEGYPDLVGKTSIGVAVEVLRQTAGYIGFSSGLGMIHTVLDKPTMLLWPAHQQALSTSWAPPEMLEQGTYVAMPWVSPDEVFKAAEVWHRTTLGMKACL